MSSGNALSHGTVHICSYEYAEAVNDLRGKYGDRPLVNIKPGLVVANGGEFYICPKKSGSTTSCRSTMLNTPIEGAVNVKDLYEAFKIVRGCRDIAFIGIEK